MRCPDCGQLLPDTARRCPACGRMIDLSENVAYEEETSPMVGQEEDSTFKAEDTWHEAPENTVYQQPEIKRTRRRSGKQKFDKPMKWWWFLTRISLILTSVMNVFSGIECILGWQYQDADYAEQIYTTYGLLKPLDVVYGILLILFGIYAMVVRHELLKLRKAGPKHLLLIYVVSAFISVGYCAVASLITDVNMMTTYLALSTLLTLLMVILNKIYFDRRSHIFVN